MVLGGARQGKCHLYAPGLRATEEIRAVSDAVSKPVNVLALPGLSLTEIVAAGARRVSVGGNLTWVTVKAIADAAEAMRGAGDCSARAATTPVGEWFAD
jgi:2-methylisocitrate lyase-like PEP mutase family enzyme